MCALLLAFYLLAGEVVRTVNFVVHAPDAAQAQQVAGWAEQMRSELLTRWSGDPNARPAPWPRPVTITVHRDHPGFFATEFLRDGTAAITLWAGDLHLQSTVRHEVCHAVLHLRYPASYIPRWLDEGLAVCQELPAEQRRQLAPLGRAERRFALRQLFSFSEYPRDVGLFYAQSYSLVSFLVERHGEPALLRFLEASFTLGQENALRQALGYASIEELERRWLESLSRT
jgi:hypothetical protein